ncbi:cytochrome P450 [Marasmius fiardii PR-910]|nr:cytochrome P450 [Marasmius fiardii PR-910]
MAHFLEIPPDFSGALLSISSLAIATAVTLLLLRRRSSNLPLPPGPPGLPIIGNLLDMPSSFPAHNFKAIAEKLKTDIVYLNVGGTNLLVLNSIQATDDLLEKRSSIYSGRPRFTMINELMGWDREFIFMPYGNDWKAHRRLFQQEFPNGHVNPQHHPHELKANRALLQNLLNDPKDFREHLRLMAGALMISMTYGIDVKDKGNRYFQFAEAGLDVVLHALHPGTFLVDSLPWLKYTPEWFPGASFKSSARKWSLLHQRLEHEAFDATKRDMATGAFQPSFVSSSIQRMLHDDQDTHNAGHDSEALIRETASTMYGAGMDALFTALLTFVLAMTCYPEYRAKAQQEIDRVVGNGRLPELSDRNSLPYCEAIMKEVFRWQPTGPVGMSHHISVEDEYRGYRIPRDTTVILNIWSIFHDETTYPDSYSFKPERWLTTLEDGQVAINPDICDIDIVFGSGRRICPGRHLALSATFLNIVSILSVFDIQKPIDESTGKVIEPSMEYLSSLLNRPAPFECNIRPRSDQHKMLINRAMDPL